MIVDETTDEVESVEEFDESTIEVPEESNEPVDEADELMMALAEDGEREGEMPETEVSAEGTELESYDSAEVEEKEFVEEEQMMSILESMLFATDRPQSLATLKQAFKGTTVKTKDVKNAIEKLTIDYASGVRGVTLEEVNGGFQLRTKVDNMNFLRRVVKSRTFKLSGPALEVLSIVAYKQPCIKSDVDEIRGVESGHLLRGLMERSMVCFNGKSELPGKPMYYGTTKKFLEIFGLRNLQELPSLSEIDELIPEGIGEIEEKDESLSDITSSMSNEAASTYSEGEEELTKIADTLSDIDTSSDFFEEEKRRQKAKRDADRARDLREALEVNEEIEAKDQRWLDKYEAKLLEEQQAAEAKQTAELEAADVVTEMSEDVAFSADAVSDESDELLAAVQEITEQKIEEKSDESEVLAAETEEDSTSIGSVDFAKLGEDLEIFNEEPPKE